MENYTGVPTPTDELVKRASAVRNASLSLAQCTNQQRRNALNAMANALHSQADKIVDANLLVDFITLETNIKIDQITYPEYPYSIAYKLYEPLPVPAKSYVTVVREMIPPIEETSHNSGKKF